MGAAGAAEAPVCPAQSGAQGSGGAREEGVVRGRWAALGGLGPQQVAWSLPKLAQRGTEPKPCL